jgi:hypothetical protein
MSAAAGAGAAAAAAIAAAIKASGTLVRVDPREFQRLLDRQKDALVVHTEGGVIRKNYQYLMGYRGLTFYTKSPEPLSLPRGTEVVLAASIWMPH